ncbi:hypothetical protein ACFXTH_000346 [Malus domestica]
MAINVLINKLIEECSKCQIITNRNTIKTIRFEDEPNTSPQTLGPLFKDNVPEAIIEMFKEHCLKSLFLGLVEMGISQTPGRLALTTATWVPWVTWMENHRDELRSRARDSFVKLLVLGQQHDGYPL